MIDPGVLIANRFEQQSKLFCVIARLTTHGALCVRRLMFDKPAVQWTDLPRSPITSIGEFTLFDNARRLLLTRALDVTSRRNELKVDLMRVGEGTYYFNLEVDGQSMRSSITVVR